MKELIKQLLAIHTEARQRANKAMENLGPLDQHQLAGTVSSALREFEWTIERISDVTQKITAMAETLEEHEKEVIQAAMDKALSDGEILSKENHEGLVAAAKKSGADEEIEKFNLQAKKAEKIKARREEVSKAHSEAVAEAMNEEALEADNFMAEAQVLATRADTMKEAGITSELEVFGKMLAANEEEFTNYMELANNLSAGKKTGNNKPNLSASRKGGTQAPPEPSKAGNDSDSVPTEEDIASFA